MTQKRPRCFQSQQQFDEWRQLARMAREQASPCSDCTAAHEARMRTAGLCDKKAVRREFSIIFSKPSRRTAIQEALPA